MTKPNSQSTVEEVRDYLFSNYEKGVRCPCCRQNVKQYKRRFNSGMAVSLIYIIRLTKSGILDDNDGWMNIQVEFAKHYNQNANRMDYSQLKRWGLIEQKLNFTDPTKKESGFWRITQKGINVANRRGAIPKYVYLYNDEIEGFSDETVVITEALKAPFDYSELMGNDLLEGNGQTELNI